MSFYEGLHRHAALMMCLLDYKIYLVSNKVNHDNLTANYFKTKVSIKEFKEPYKLPLEQLERISIDEDVKVPMLTTLVTIRAFIPRITVSKIKHGDLEVLLKASRVYNENISITKRTSDDESMTIRLADILKTIEKMSKPAAQHDDQVRQLLTDTFKNQVDVTLALHLSNMKNENDDNYVCYKYSDKLRGDIWDRYSLDALNITVRENYTKTLSLKEQYKEKISVPVGLHFKSFTDDIPAETKTNKGEKYLESGHMNAFLLIPPITTIINAKLQNKPLRSMVNDKDNARIIS
jgi:hypothetical protein